MSRPQESFHSSEQCADKQGLGSAPSSLMTQGDVRSLHRRVSQAQAMGPPSAGCEAKERSQARCLPSWGLQSRKGRRSGNTSEGLHESLLEHREKKEVREGRICLQNRSRAQPLFPSPPTPTVGTIISGLELLQCGVLHTAGLLLPQGLCTCCSRNIFMIWHIKFFAQMSFLYEASPFIEATQFKLTAMPPLCLSTSALVGAIQVGFSHYLLAGLPLKELRTSFPLALATVYVHGPQKCTWKCSTLPPVSVLGSSRLLQLADPRPGPLSSWRNSSRAWVTCSPAQPPTPLTKL